MPTQTRPALPSSAKRPAVRSAAVSPSRRSAPAKRRRPLPTLSRSCGDCSVRRLPRVASLTTTRRSSSHRSSESRPSGSVDAPPLPPRPTPLICQWPAASRARSSCRPRTCRLSRCREGSSQPPKSSFSSASGSRSALPLAPAAAPTVTSCSTNSGPDGVQRPSSAAKLTGRCSRWLSWAATHAGWRASCGSSSSVSAISTASRITSTPATQPSARAQRCSRRCHSGFTRGDRGRIYSKTTSNCSCE